jgi:hypothetical protein
MVPRDERGRFLPRRPVADAPAEQPPPGPPTVELLGARCEEGNHYLCPGWWPVAAIVPDGAGVRGVPGRCTCWHHKEER